MDPRRAIRYLLGIVMTTALVSCGTAGSPTAGASADKIAVVAAEDFWGSIARQLGGDRVSVTSLIANPDTDPHSYEPTPADGRVLASARYVITNGVGYDPWADKALSANPVAGRVSLRVGDLSGLKEGDNPHRWYSPTDVEKVVDQITSDLKRLAPSDAAFFSQLHDSFVTGGLHHYKATITAIRSKYSGVPVGASESIFSPMASALELKLVTPASFLTAVSEGTDPTAADKAAVDEQIKNRAIKVFVFNGQNSTPDVQRLVDAAKANGIQVATVTETLTPKGATFQDWQTAQLEQLAAALATATGR